MNRIHTHYDNLKVARNAPVEVIRAAYRVLCQKYHPDLNPGNTRATKNMAIINTSYEVLSDPDRRRKYDLHLLQQEQPPRQWTTPSDHAPSKEEKTAPRHGPLSGAKKAPPRPNIETHPVAVHLFKYWFLYAFVIFIFVVPLLDDSPRQPAGPKPYQAVPDTPKSKYARPSNSPNGKPWPASSGYIKGYRRLHTEGLSSVTVNNNQNDSDVFVKLVSLDSAKAYPARQFFISGHGSFTLNNVTSGSYDIRYRDLDSGGLSRSEAFTLKETETENGTRYSNLTMTLYKVRNGNMKTYGLSETEF
jgi:curved DNA-binding protein CbpA